MPKKILTKELAGELNALAQADLLSSLKITQYKSGKNKGKNYAVYEEGAFPTPDLTKHYLRLIFEDINRDIVAELKEDGHVLFEITEVLEK